MSYESNFSGKAAIVTGAGRGIGRAIAVKLDALGVSVYAVSQNPANLAALQKECPKIQTVAVDLGNWKATRDAIEKLPPVDYLVNNAGIYKANQFLQVTEDEFDSVANVNLKAVINVSQIVAKKMIAAGKPGSIVNVSSTAGLKAFTFCCTYTTLKAGLDHLTKVMAIELGASNIRVNSVNPSNVDTDMNVEILEGLKVSSAPDQTAVLVGRIPGVQKLVGIDEVVGTTLFLLSDSAPMITGSSLALDGGYCIS